MNDTIEHPEQWYTSVYQGVQGRFGEGFGFQRGQENKAESFGGFRGLFLKGTNVPGPGQNREEANTAAIGRGLRNPNHRGCSFQGSSRDRAACTSCLLEQVAKDKVLYQEVLSVVASLGTPDCKDFSPQCIPVRAHRLGHVLCRSTSAPACC